MISLNRKSNKFEVVLGLFLIIFFTPSLILSFLVNDTLYYESSISVGVMDHITKSLNSPLLSDLEAIPADSPCSAGFETLILGQFPGTTTLLGTWNLPPVDLTIWNGTKLCGQRISSYRYAYIGDCLESEIECGENLCIKDAEQCPITDVTFEYVQRNSSKLQTIPFGKKGFIGIQREKGQLPLQGFEIGFTVKTCYADGYTPSKDQIPQELNVKNECGSYGIDESTSMLTYQELKLTYSENGLDSILDQVDGIEALLVKKEGYLLAKKRIEISQSKICHDFAKDKEEGLLAMREIQAWRGPIFVPLIILYSVILFLSLMAFGGVLVKKQSYKDKLGLNYSFNLPVILSFICFALEIASNNWLYGMIKTYQERDLNYVPMADWNCFIDKKYEQAAHDLSKFDNELTNTAASIRIMLVIGIIRMLFPCFCIVFGRACLQVGSWCTACGSCLNRIQDPIKNQEIVSSARSTEKFRIQLGMKEKEKEKPPKQMEYQLDTFNSPKKSPPKVRYDGRKFVVMKDQFNV